MTNNVIRINKRKKRHNLYEKKCVFKISIECSFFCTIEGGHMNNACDNYYILT